MITDKDILKLSKVFVTKEDLRESSCELKEEIKKEFSDLLTSVDGYAKKVDDYHQEMKMLGNKVDRNENRIEKLELKTGLEGQ